jgi:MFS transporter, DHA1 family, inner membrane transport protein
MNTQAPVPRHVLPVLVLAQFAGTSLWFAVNAVMPDLQREFGWPATTVGTLTSALQAGFIAGTLVFALLAIADRFPPRRVFLLCALAGSGCTVGAWAMVSDFGALLAWRFSTGFFLAGIYPVGMKIAAQWYTRGLGPALGLLIGALVLGSASAHALRAIGDTLPWPTLMLGVAALAEPRAGCRSTPCCPTRLARWRA